MNTFRHEQRRVKDMKYMHWALEGARTFSTCGKRQHMAIILDDAGFVCGVGYNGVPSGFTHCIDGGCPRLNDATTAGSNYDNCLSNHAEQNAIMNSDSRRTRVGGTIFVTGEPCFTCAKLIVGSGIKKIVITKDPEYVYQDFDKVEELFKKAGLPLVILDWNELHEP